MLFRRLFSTSSRSIISITENAWTQISTILTKSQSPAFLFSAQGGGCNGFNYQFQIVSNQEYQKWMLGKLKPTTINFDSSIVIIDPMSELLLMGTTIDYVSNLYENKFTFQPDKKLATSCGCGVSFSPRNN